MLLKKTRPSIAGGLIPGIVLLLSGGVAQAQIEVLETTPPEMVEISKPESVGATPPESLKITQPGSLNRYEPKSQKAGGFQGGEYAPPKRDNPEYDRCAQQKGFDAQLKCAQEAIGIAQE